MRWSDLKRGDMIVLSSIPGDRSARWGTILLLSNWGGVVYRMAQTEPSGFKALECYDESTQLIDYAWGLSPEAELPNDRTWVILTRSKAHLLQEKKRGSARGLSGESTLERSTHSLRARSG